MTTRKTIALIQTGGTIASKSASEFDARYSISDTDIMQILPRDILDKIEIKNVNFSQIDSKDVSVCFWLNLATKVREMLEISYGVVITHGTDTMSESAYFLSLVIDSKKPVVLTGAMRNLVSASSDAVLNLYNGVSVAMSDEAVGKGVMIAINDEIHAARDVQKSHPTALNAFSSFAGKLGVVNYGEVQFHSQSLKLHTQNSKLKNSEIFVDTGIVYAYPGFDLSILKAFKTKGLVVIAYANATLSNELEDELKKIAKAGTTVVVASNTHAGVLTNEYENFITANSLSPQKARILLALALGANMSFDEIKELFKTH